MDKLIPQKAQAGDFQGRFREIISDPLNLLISRHPRAGVVENDHVCLHNGISVPITGPLAYYSEFSSILIYNRGVHEPLEEFVFQQLCRRLPKAPTMLELGAYWGHYSMWLKSLRPDGSVFLVEPNKTNILSGQHNFKINSLEGRFLQALVGKGAFCVDKHLADEKVQLTILHSDIQGAEVEMLQDAKQSLLNKKVDYVLISTHSQELHASVFRTLTEFGYRVEVSSDYAECTTSYDGLIFASRPDLAPVFNSFSPLSRVQITQSSPIDLVRYLNSVSESEHLDKPHS